MKGYLDLARSVAKMKGSHEKTEFILIGKKATIKNKGVITVNCLGKGLEEYFRSLVSFARHKYFRGWIFFYFLIFSRIFNEVMAMLSSSLL